MIGRIVNNIKGDKYIWYVVLILSAFSLLLVYSSTRSLAYRDEQGNTEYYLFKHGFILSVGLFIIYFVHRIDHRYFSRIAQMMLLISIPLLLYTKFFGVKINDASRWIRIPGGLTFQSSDFAKLALIMYTARMLSKKQGVIKDIKEVLIHIMLPIVVICGLIMLDNLSSAAILFMTCIVVLFSYLGKSVHADGSGNGQGVSDQAESGDAAESECGCLARGNRRDGTIPDLPFVSQMESEFLETVVISDAEYRA